MRDQYRTEGKRWHVPTTFVLGQQAFESREHFEYRVQQTALAGYEAVERFGTRVTFKALVEVPWPGDDFVQAFFDNLDGTEDTRPC